MNDVENQQEWLDGLSPADDWDAHATQRVLDELFCYARQYRSSQSYDGLLKFVVRFRFYSPYNAMLVRAQMPGAPFVAPAHRWSRKYGRTIKVDARPLVILQPMGPVMLVFDVADTEPGKDSKPLPPEVEKPFEVRGGKIGKELDRTVENAKRDGIRIQPRKEGSQSAGSIRPAVGGKVVFDAGNDRDGNPKLVQVPLRYDILYNETASKESRYATVVHELAHLYCGHVGSPNPKWWPDRRGLDLRAEEFEAESVAYLVCARVGIDNPSEEYLAGYFQSNGEVPNISVDLVMKAAGLIEQMGRERMKPRKEREVNETKTPVPKIMATERVRQRFGEELIRHMVERSLFKMSQCPDRVTEWVSHYRTVYGEVTVVYAKEPHAAIVAYDDEMPKGIPTKAGDDGTYGSDYRLSDEEWKRHAQAMWQATGGKFDAPLPRPDHKDVAGISFVTRDKDLVSLEELANDPFFNDIEKWYDELESLPGRFKVAAVAYHSDGETYRYAPVLGGHGRHFRVRLAVRRNVRGSPQEVRHGDSGHQAERAVHRPMGGGRRPRLRPDAVVFLRRQGCGDTRRQRQALSEP